MLMDGLIITVVGMGTVFLFLTLLVYSMHFTTKVIEFLNKFMPEEVTAPVTVSSRKKDAEEDVAVAIAVAKMNMK